MAIPNKPNLNSKPNQNPYDAFQRSNGRLTKQQMHQYMDRLSIRPDQREYTKRVLERYDNPGWDQGITRDEFFKGLDEMAKNPHDPINPQEAERIKQHFSK